MSLTFGLYRRSLSDFVLLQENEILQGIALAGHYTHQLLEGAGASTLMAAIKLRTRLRGKKVMLQFSGANASSDEINKPMDCLSLAKALPIRIHFRWSKWRNITHNKASLLPCCAALNIAQ